VLDTILLDKTGYSVQIRPLHNAIHLCFL